MTQNSSHASGNAALTAEQFYDLLMEQIDPALTTEGLQHLEQKMEGMTPMEKARLLERFEESFDTFDRLSSTIESAAKSDAMEHRQTTRSKMLAKEATEHSSDAKNAEDLLNSSTTAL